MEALPAVDAVFVFGNYNPDVASHAADLWTRGKAPRIIVTGKGGFRLPDAFATEADFFASILRERGIPEDELTLEREATNSLENVCFGMRAAIQSGHSPRSLILCAIPPLLRRARATFRRQFPGIETFGSAFSLAPDWFTPRRINRYAVGEIDRLIAYVKRGDIEPVPLTDELLTAVEVVRCAGLEE